MNEAHFASVIRSYWSERGYSVDVDVRSIPVHGKNGTTYYSVVRSSLIGGLPPGYVDLTTKKIAAAG